MTRTIILAIVVAAIASAVVATVMLLHTTSVGHVKELHVLCGAGLMKPVNELIKEFENETGIKVVVDYGGSGEILAKLELGEGDVFIPGAYYYMEIALRKHLVVPTTVKNVTLHIPVIAVPSGNPGHVHGLRDLLRPGIRIALGDPRACAIGRVALKLFKKNGLWNLYEEKLKRGEIVFAPTVNQLLIYVVTRQVDAAIVWEDMVTWAQAKGRIEIIEIPPSQNIIKTIPAAVTVFAEKHGVYREALEFVKFITSPQGIKVWEKWGFKPWNASTLHVGR